MKEMLSCGYNSLSAVIGAYYGKEDYPGIIDVIHSQYTFMWDKELFWQNGCFAGAALNPTEDYLLEDLQKYQNICLTPEHIQMEDEIAELKRNKRQIVCFNFSKLKVKPRVVLAESFDPQTERILITDPYYDIKWEVTEEQYVGNRGNMENIKIMSDRPSRMKVDPRQLFYDRVERFYALKMYDNIIDLEEETDKRRLIGGKKQTRYWTWNLYVCLRSSFYQHRNINRFIRTYGINVPNEFIELEDHWEKLLDKLLNYYRCKADGLEEICHLILKTGRAERDCSECILQSR